MSGKQENRGEKECVGLRYWGHSCFEIQLPTGHSLVLDPHDGSSIGLPEPRARGDLVLVTHDHHDHNAAELVAKPGAEIIVEMEGRRETRLGDVTVVIEARRAPHDREGGRRRGLVSIYKITLPGGLVFVHLGDLGVVPEEGLLQWLGSPRPTLLMVPVGGFFTLEPYEAWEVVERVRPVYAVPMHYWVRGSMLPLLKVWDFLLTARTGRVEASGVFRVCPGEAAGDKTRVLVFREWLY